MVGAPNTPRATASSVVAFRWALTVGSLTHCATSPLGKPALASAVLATCASFMSRLSTQMALKAPSVMAATCPGACTCAPAMARISVSVLMGKNGLRLKGTP